MSTKPDHKPRLKDASQVCTRCGFHASKHRKPPNAVNRARYMRGYNAAHPRPNASERIIGLDGEGQGRKPHLYNYLAAADEAGKVWELGEDPKARITTSDALDFILGLPTRALIFGFAFLYDWTKILSDLPDRKLYLLFHPEKRAYFDDGELRYRPVKWKRYSLNYMQRKMSLQSFDDKGKRLRRATVWDVFAFFQSKFTKACIDWSVGDAATIKRMEEMKEKRGSFDAQGWEEIKTYCQTECKHLALLGRELLTAHEDAGFKLKSYYGAGSTASALMKKHAVKEYIGEIPTEMREPVACAFFGGRFENSVIGPVNRPVWNADISSAYPYAATFLPCLIHGRWRCVQRSLDREIERARLALIEWTLPALAPSGPSSGPSSWGPLPVRKADGCIAFPLSARGGWTWKQEFDAARRLRPDVVALRAWLYTVDCACRPFSFLPEVYLERLRIGKDSRGIVLKLGPNSVYGKLVQSVGFQPPFQCWVWGGNITSQCRAQLLEAIHLADRPSTVLMLATDGVWSDTPIALPAPRNTGTSHTPKPLGGWEVKEYPRGVFAARPGIYFPLHPTEQDIVKVRARGLGRKVLYDKHRAVVEAFERGEASVTVSGGQRFVGVKTGVTWFPSKGAKRSDVYGEWIDWPTQINFDPRPKRCAINRDRTLQCWEHFEAPSLPYDKALRTDEDLMLELSQLIAEEQPNADFVEVD